MQIFVHFCFGVFLFFLPFQQCENVLFSVSIFLMAKRNYLKTLRKKIQEDLQYSKYAFNTVVCTIAGICLNQAC